jgi:uncharacterized membrane protein YciS (DUF1049 family)
MTTAFWTGFAVGFVVCGLFWVAAIMWFGRTFGGGG